MRTGNRSSILRIEVGVDLVEKVERRRVAALDAEDERKCDERLLTARKLLDAKSLITFRVE